MLYRCKQCLMIHRVTFANNREWLSKCVFPIFFCGLSVDSNNMHSWKACSQIKNMAKQCTHSFVCMHSTLSTANTSFSSIHLLKTELCSVSKSTLRGKKCLERGLRWECHVPAAQPWLSVRQGKGKRTLLHNISPCLAILVLVLLFRETAWSQ